MPDHPRAEAGESGFGRSNVAVATDGVESLKVVFCSERSTRMKRFVQVVLVASLAFLGSSPSWACGHRGGGAAAASGVAAASSGGGGAVAVGSGVAAASSGGGGAVAAGSGAAAASGGGCCGF